MSQGANDISYLGLFFTFIIPLLIVSFDHFKRFGLAKDIAISSLKMTLQLIGVGFVLIYIFYYDHLLITFSYIGIMIFFACKISKSRIKNKDPDKTNKVALLFIYQACILSSFSVLLYVIFIIIRPTNAFSPQYIIPIYGMLLGNTITAIVLSVNDYNQKVHTEKQQLQSLLNLGVDPKVALDLLLKDNFKVALMPILTSMVSLGIVSLPGMMTGQILGGTLPLVAIKYQIVIMLSIFGSSSFAVIILHYLIKKNAINAYNQLRIYR